MDYYRKTSKAKLYVHDQFGPKVEMPISVYFRKERQMPELEKEALQNCKGKILDIGAGSGSHALALQLKGFEVHALEISKASCEVMEERGIDHVICEDFFLYEPKSKFDTLLLLMNGIGLCASIDGLRIFLNKAKSLLNPGGTLLFDSCDIAYMYEGMGFPEHYYGEVKCRYEYQKQLTEWFNWLYIDQETLEKVASEEGWTCKILAEDDSDQYLAQLKLA